MSSGLKVDQILHKLSNNSNPLPLSTTNMHGGPVDCIEQGHDNHEDHTDHKVNSKYRVGGLVMVGRLHLQSIMLKLDNDLQHIHLSN